MLPAIPVRRELIGDGTPVADVPDGSHRKVVSLVLLILIAGHGGRP